MKDPTLEELVAANEALKEMGRGIPIGVKLHPEDWALLALRTPRKEPEDLGFFQGLNGLPVYLDDSVERGTPEFIYRDSDVTP